MVLSADAMVSSDHITVLAADKIMLSADNLMLSADNIMLSADKVISADNIL
jgi:hypothetical protein